MTELPKTFEPGPIEARWYDHWEKSGQFRPARGDAEPFTIVMPPPNVTGSLHIGHALDNTLQDILIRRARMQGKDSLWVVGTDHAGIATQMVVERQLDLEQKKRADLGREAFLERVWQWKGESGGQITRQLRRLGASCDWSNERFTMDTGFSAALTKVFVELHKRGRIYRDKRLVNWDPRFQSAISDLEVETREVQGSFWTLRYPLADGATTATGSSHIKVATTRPETMLADMAVAVHPEDERYKALIGHHVVLPITGRRISIIADDHADPELGSGAVKITPGHDFNDFEVGKRAGFAARDMLNMFDASAHVMQTADGLVPAELIGLDRDAARRRVLELVMEGGFLDKVEDRTIATPFGDRSGVVIEPWLTDQWYFDVAPLAERAMQATRSGAVKIVPESWAKTWYNWLENIQPWCVSRQLWWGHRIPVWYYPPVEKSISGLRVVEEEADGSLKYTITTGHVVAENEELALAEIASIHGVGVDQLHVCEDKAEYARHLLEDRTLVPVLQDQDVLDTWFSSALWPFATLGWPEQTADLARHYPNDVLISGFDILFFWDARMAMQGLEFMDEVPWRTLYLHGLVRDAQGQKMSKSKGNTVDPLGLIDRYGADALRFTLTAMESQGRDIKLDEKRVEGYRNFATKLWNAARFLQMNGVGPSQSVEAPPATLAVNRWIIGEVVETLGRLDRAFDELRFDGMADAVYHFAWGTFCDWYVELIKGAFDEETKAVAAWVFDQILVMLHPFMPFITEELWHGVGERPYDLIVAKWPAPKAAVDAAAKAEIDWLIRLVGEVRSARTELSVPPGARLQLFAGEGGEGVTQRLERQFTTLSRLARLESIQRSAFAGPGAAQVVVDGLTYALPLEGVIDLDAERARLAKAIAVAKKDRDGLAARLGNPSFTERAKPEAVEKARADHDARAAEAERLAAALARLG